MAQRAVLETTIAAAPAVVFDLALDMREHEASTGRSRETATTSTGRDVLGPGDEVTFTARHLGLPWRMTSRVTEYERPTRFVDEQIHGPFQKMRHEHEFVAVESGTLMRDTFAFDVQVPGAGPVARLVLRRLLRTRADHLRRRAEAHAG